MSEFKYVRLFAAPDGESHFEDVAVEFTSVFPLPPAAPVVASDWQSAERIGFLSVPPGWRGDPHPAPRRGFDVFLAGTFAFQASDGEIRHFHAGDILLAEDTTGTGHSSWNADDDTVVCMEIQVPD